MALCCPNFPGRFWLGRLERSLHFLDMMTSEAKKPLLGPRLEVGYFSLMKKKIAKMRLVHYKARVGEAATTIHHHLELLANPKQNYTKKPELFVAPMHTVSFD